MPVVSSDIYVYIRSETSLFKGVCWSTDATFKTANKATVTSTTKTRARLLKGGLLTVINEHNEIIAWVRILVTLFTLLTHLIAVNDSVSAKRKQTLSLKSC